MTTQTPTSKIPEFSSIEEEAEFWDTHDFTDFMDELKPVEMKYHRDLSKGITVRLDTETLTILRKRAAEKSIGTTTLIRMWIVERLNRDWYERHI